MTQPLQSNRREQRLRSRSDDLTVARYLAAWLVGKRAIRSSTHASYSAHVRNYLVPHLGPLLLAELAPHHIERMYAEIEAGNRGRIRPLSTASLRRIHATLSSALGTALRRGLISRNPAATVELPALRKPRVDAWSASELGAFLAEVDDDELGLMFRIIGLRGLRRGEAVALRWSDIDLGKGCLQVEQSAVWVGGQTTIGPTKSTASTRTVAIDSDLARRLREHRDRDRIGNPITSDLVFTDADGHPLDPTYVSRHFQRLIARHGLPRIRLHDLRHTSASVGLEAGESLLEVSRRLGHSSITVTADIYSHIAPQVAKESAQRLADLVHQHTPRNTNRKGNHAGTQEDSMAAHEGGREAR